MTMCGAVSARSATSRLCAREGRHARAHDLDLALGEIAPHRCRSSRSTYASRFAFSSGQSYARLAGPGESRSRRASSSPVDLGSIPHDLLGHAADVHAGAAEPPGSRPAATRAPYSAARCAQASPPLPPPITSRSNSYWLASHPPPDPRMLHWPLAGAPRAPEPPVAEAVQCAHPGCLACKTLCCRSAPAGFDQIRPEHVEPAIRELLERNRARIGELPQLAEPSFAIARRAARGAASIVCADLVAVEPSQCGAQFRASARALQRLPAAAVGLADRSGAERAPVPRLPAHRRARAGQPRPRPAARDRTCPARFSPGRRRAGRRAQGSASRRSCSSSRSCRRNSRRTCSMRPTPGAITSRRSRARGFNATIIEQGAPARARRAAGGLDPRRSISPPTSP